MKKYFLILAILFFTHSVNFAQTVTLTTSPVAAADIAQGTNNNIIYAVRMDVATQPVTVNSMQFTLTGTHDDNDLTVLHVFFNATAPTVAGATQKAVNVSANFAAPHTYNAIFNLGSQLLAAGSSGYFIVVADVAATATSGNTIKVNGLANPVTFGYTTSPTITNNQTDIAGTQTILAAGITLTTSAVAASNITQGTTNNIVYIAKMDVTALPITINSMQFTLGGTHDGDDLTVLHVYINLTAPTLTGATQKAVNVSANFAAPHTYNAFFNLGNQGLAAGSSAYFIVVADVAATATSGNTIKVNGLANPVSFGYTTSPTITNNQTDIAGTQTILAAGVTLTTSPLAASNITQGTNNNIIYAVRMDVAAQPVTVNSMQFTLTGTHDDNDLTVLHVFFNAAAPTLPGATQKAVNVSANFAAPHTYNAIFNLGNQLLAAGSSGYFIVVVDVPAAATIGNTIKINGAANPVSFGYTTSPVVANNQTDLAGVSTIISSTLPLSLLQFTGTTVNTTQVKLQWQTAQEINTKDFNVEWSHDGLPFNKIATIAAAGNSSQTLHYSYTHNQPGSGNNFYRLKMIDMDDRFTYSPVVKVNNFISRFSITAYPNPVADFLQLHTTAVKDETIELLLHNADGKMVASKRMTVTKGSNTQSWNVHLSAGIYFICSRKRQFNTIIINKQR